MEVYEAVRRLIAVYGQLLDTRRFDEWAQLFTEDAVFRVWGQTHEGRDTIQREICGMQREDVLGKHALLQPVIDAVGDDRALAWTDMSVMAQVDGRITVATIGCYHDEIVRSAADGRWRFASRAIVMAGDSPPEGVRASPAY